MAVLLDTWFDCEAWIVRHNDHQVLPLSEIACGTRARSWPLVTIAPNGYQHS